MPRPRSTGLNVARRRRADGSTVEYFYDAQTRQFLGHDRQGALERIASLNPVRPTPGTFSAAIGEYLDSPDYEDLAPRTQALYRGYLDQMRTLWGDMLVRSLSAHELQRVRDALRATPRKANMILALFRILLGRALNAGTVTVNVARGVPALAVRPRSEIWTKDGEAAFLEAAKDDPAGDVIQLAILLLLYTVQRPSDVLDMQVERISERDGRLFIALRQAKTGTLLDLPLHHRLTDLVRRRMAASSAETARSQAAGLPARPAYLIPSPRGLLWSRRNFSRAWDRVLARANYREARRLFGQGLSKSQVREALEAQHRQRRDLRRTGIVRLAEAGATTPQIAAISGHAIDYCQRIIDTYLPRTTAVAVAGIRLWEQHQSDQEMKIVRIASKRRS